MWHFYVRGGGVKRAWTTPGQVNQKRLAAGQLTDGYYLDFSPDADYPGPFDEQGVPLIDYAGSIGLRHNPWYVGHYGLACYERYVQTGDREFLGRMIAQADWLLASKVETPYGADVWTYEFSAWHPYSAPWISALAQAHAISVLLRAYLCSKKDDYGVCAERALLAMQTPVEQGGVLCRDLSGLTTFEERADRGCLTVLNGLIFAIWGVWEYQSLWASSAIGELLEEVCGSLLKLLSEYDLGYWSSYNLRQGRFGIPSVASPFYHRVHLAQLEVMAALTGEKEYERYASRWRGYQESWVCRQRALLTKSLYKLTTA